jgi:hypothetical protein
MRTTLTEPEGPDGPTTIGMTPAGRPTGRRWRPRHPVGWLLLALGLSVAVDGVANGYVIYGAAQTIAAFSARLRDEIDLNTLTGELLAVVDTTIQPTQASLWLRPPRQPSGTASVP